MAQNKIKAADLNSTTGTGAVVLATSPALTTPDLGTPSALVATNASGTATNLTAGAANAIKSATTTVNVSSATAPSSGQVLTATSSTAATWQTPSGGTGITWTEVTGTTQTASVNNGYITNNASLVTVTLPTTAAVGSIIRITGKGAGGWRLAQNASQQVIWFEGGTNGTTQTTSGTGGRIDSTDDYDSIELLCITADTIFGVLSSKGNPSLT